jgi:streptogrisin C
MLGMVAIISLTITMAPAAPAAADLTGTSSCTSATVIAPTQAPEASPDLLPAGALEDLTRSAEQEGISLADAVDRYAWHESLSLVVSQVKDAYPAQYAGARIEATGAAQAWVAFAGTAPAAAIDLLRTSPVPVAVRQHCSHSEAELKTRLEEVHHAIWDRGDVVADVSSGYDLETGELTVLVQPREVLDASDQIQLRNELVAGLPSDPSGLPVDVQIVDDTRTGDDASVLGGRAISTCTTGFNVVGVISRGTATAGHCGNSQSYSGRALSFVKEHQGRFGDLQWHRRASDSFPNTFDAGPSNRGVAAARAAVENQRLCRNGKTTGHHCDNVFQLNHCKGSRCGLVMMRNDQASGGDSGGPWFYNLTAYGIHQGSKWWKGESRDVYTPVVYLPSALGVSVATS